MNASIEPPTVGIFLKLEVYSFTILFILCLSQLFILIILLDRRSELGINLLPQDEISNIDTNYQ